MTLSPNSAVVRAGGKRRAISGRRAARRTLDGGQMPQSFTHYWAGETLGFNEEGRPLDHTAGSDFSTRGVKIGNTIYVVNILRGELYLVGRFTVGEFLFSDAEARARLGYEPWSAKEHIIARPGTGTPTRLGRVVPLEIVRRLKFHTTQGVKGLAFVDAEELDRQALRGVRRLTQPSAKLLDDFIIRKP